MSSGDPQLTVPSVREVAVAGDFAMIGGYSAWFLASLITKTPGGLDVLLSRSGVPTDKREDVLRAVAALQHVGARWRADLASTSGSPEGQMLDPPALSGEMNANEAATVLQISARRVGQLAATGDLVGRKDSGGRWIFHRDEVVGFRERRNQEAA